MQRFQILTDSTADIPPGWLKEHDYITVIDTPINIVGDGFNETLYNLGPDDFGKVDDYVKQGYRASTSQPVVNDPDGLSPLSVETITRSYLDEGKDVIYIAMNGSISGTYSTVYMCYKRLQEEYNQYEDKRRIICVDSECMSCGLALLLMDVANFIEEVGDEANVDRIAEFVAANRASIGHFFTFGELSYIRRSGRLGFVKATIGNVLGVRPFCSAAYNDEGSRKLEYLNSHTLVRGLNKLANAMSQYVLEHIADPKGKIIIAYGNVIRDAENMFKRIHERLPDAEYLIGQDWRVGAAVQANGGPTSLLVAFHTKDRNLLSTVAEDVNRIIREQRNAGK